MTREQVANHMNKRHPDPNDMYQVVQAWHRDVMKKEWQPTQVNVQMLGRAYQEALNELSKHHGVSILYDQHKRFIKAF
jgi:hypothetical protein